jgi:death on curing protein
VPGLVAEPRWLPLAAVIEINRMVTAAAREPHALEQRFALETALAQPRNKWFYGFDADIAMLAAVLFAGIAGVRAFARGNARTAFVAALAFIAANGGGFAMPDQPEAAGRLRDFIAHRLSQDGLTEWFRLWVTPAA